MQNNTQNNAEFLYKGESKFRNYLFLILAGFSYKGNIEQEKSDQQKEKDNLGIKTEINDIHSPQIKTRLFGMFGSSGFSEEGDIHQQQYNQKQGGRDLGSIGQIDKVFRIHSYSNFSSIFTEKIKNTIPNVISFVNRISPETVPMLTKLGVINATPNHPAAKLVKSPERTLSWESVSSILNCIIFIVAN